MFNPTPPLDAARKNHQPVRSIPTPNRSPRASHQTQIRPLPSRPNHIPHIQHRIHIIRTRIPHIRVITIHHPSANLITHRLTTHRHRKTRPHPQILQSTEQRCRIMCKNIRIIRFISRRVKDIPVTIRQIPTRITRRFQTDILPTHRNVSIITPTNTSLHRRTTGQRVTASRKAISRLPYRSPLSHIRRDHPLRPFNPIQRHIIRRSQNHRSIIDRIHWHVKAS